MSEFQRRLEANIRESLRFAVGEVQEDAVAHMVAGVNAVLDHPSNTTPHPEAPAQPSSKGDATPPQTHVEACAALVDVAAERRRQVEKEDFDASHDDMATRGQLAGAAACYAMTGIEHWARDQAIKTIWPWDEGWWKPTDRRRDLVKAGALIIAEIERLDRATLATTEGK